MRRGAPVGEAVIEGAGEGQCRSHDSLPISGYGFIGDGAHLRRRGGDAEETQKRKRGKERKRGRDKKAKRQKGKKAHEKTRETGGRTDKTRRARIRRRHLP